MIGSEPEAWNFCAAHTDAAGLARLERFAELLRSENQRQNLVSASSMRAIWQRHFADSLQLLNYVPREAPGPWLDLGSGAGFPGLALAAARPDIDFLLIESRKRRVEWLEQVASELGLRRCRVLGIRLEAAESSQAAVITARAFAPLSKLLALSARFSTSDTLWLLPKGRSAAQELAQQPEVMRQMFHVEQSLTDPDGGILVGQGIPNQP